MSRKRQKQYKANDNFTQPIILEPKTENQSHFMTAIDDNDVVICDSISGTGKTTISVGMAVKYLQDGKVEKIIVMRPAIQCGPDLGHLPGNERQKIQPYMNPVIEALDHFLTPLKRKEYEATGKICIEVIGYLRGRNLHDSFIIVDEMQNATASQLKMIGTRIGKHSKAVFVGDMSQTDLGFSNSQEIYDKVFNPIRGSKRFAFVKLTAVDIVRSYASKIFTTKCL